MFDEIGGEFEAISIATPDFPLPCDDDGLGRRKTCICRKANGRTFQEVDLMVCG